MLSTYLFSLFQNKSLILTLIFACIYLGLYTALKAEIYAGKYDVSYAFLPFVNSFIEFKLAGMGPALEIIDAFPLIFAFRVQTEKIYFYIMIWGIIRTILFTWRNMKLVENTLGQRKIFGILITLDPAIAKIALFLFGDDDSNRKNHKKAIKTTSFILICTLLASAIAPSSTVQAEQNVSEYYQNENNYDQYAKADITNTKISAKSKNFNDYVTKSVIYSKSKYYIKSALDLWFQGENPLPLRKVVISKVEFGVIPKGKKLKGKKISKDLEVFYIYLDSYFEDDQDGSIQDNIIEVRESNSDFEDYPECRTVVNEELLLKHSEMLKLDLDVLDYNYADNEAVEFKSNKKKLSSIEVNEKYLYYDRNYERFNPQDLVCQSIAYSVVAYNLQSFWNSKDLGQIKTYVNDIYFRVFDDKQLKDNLKSKWINDNEKVFMNVNFSYASNERQSAILAFPANYSNYKTYKTNSFNDYSYVQCFNGKEQDLCQKNKCVKLDIDILSKYVKKKNTIFLGKILDNNQNKKENSADNLLVYKVPTEDLKKTKSKISEMTYLDKVLLQTFLGELSGKNTFGGLVGEIAFAFTGLDFYKDVSDFAVFLSRKDYVGAAITSLSFFPVIGSIGKALNDSVPTKAISEGLRKTDIKVFNKVADDFDDLNMILSKNKKAEKGIGAVIDSYCSDLRKVLSKITGKEAIERGITDITEEEAKELGRRTWRESEERASLMLRQEFKNEKFIAQPVFIDGKYVEGASRVKGSKIPDFVNFETKQIVDVKNYKIVESANRSSLVSNISKQYLERKEVIEGFSDFEYIVYVDVYGQNYTSDILKEVQAKVQSKCGSSKIKVYFDGGK